MLNIFENKEIEKVDVACILRTNDMSKVTRIESMGPDGHYTHSSLKITARIDTGQRDPIRRPGYDAIYDTKFNAWVGSVVMHVPNQLRGDEGAQFYVVTLEGLRPLADRRAVRRVLAGGSQPTVETIDSCCYDGGWLYIHYSDTAGGDSTAEYLVRNVDELSFDRIPDEVADLDLDEEGLDALDTTALAYLADYNRAKARAAEEEALRIEARAEELECSVALVRYIESLERRIEGALEDA